MISGGCVTLNQHIRITEVWEITHEKPRYWEPADGEDGFVEEEKGQGGLGSDGSDVFLENTGLDFMSMVGRLGLGIETVFGGTYQ